MRETEFLALALPRILAALAILIATALVLRLLSILRARVFRRMTTGPQRGSGDVVEQHQRVETVVRVGFDVLRGLALAFAVITALSQLGVSVQPLVAGAGLLGAALALGSQTVVKDFVAGFFVLLEGHFVIGDTVVLGTGLQGVVEKMTLRVTVLRDADGSVHIVPNGSIVAVTNRSYHWTRAATALQIDASAPQDTVREALERAARASKARHDEGVLLLGEPEVRGPLDVHGAGAEWSVSVKTRPGEESRVKSWLIEDALRELAGAGLALKG